MLGEIEETFDVKLEQEKAAGIRTVQEAVDGDYCFVEDTALKPYERWIEKIIVFRWNRAYPADQSFDLDLCGGNWKLSESDEFAGIEGEDVKTFLKEVLLPLLIALCLAAFFKPVYMADGVCDYFLMWLCVGFPFGIRRMCLWLVPFGYGISGTVGIFALNIIIGGLIGGLALIVGLLLGIIHTIREII